MRLAALVLTGMMSVVGAGDALAQGRQKPDPKKPAAEQQQPVESGNSLLKALNLSTDVTAPKDFVRDSRAPDRPTDYISTQAPDTPRPTRVKTPDEIRATEASLDAARARHDRILNRKPKDVGVSAAGPEKKKKKKRPGDPIETAAPAAASPMVINAPREAN